MVRWNGMLLVVVRVMELRLIACQLPIRICLDSPGECHIINYYYTFIKENIYIYLSSHSSHNIIGRLARRCLHSDVAIVRLSKNVQKPSNPCFIRRLLCDIIP